MITVRPVEIWDWHKRIPDGDKKRLRAEHEAGRFAFYPSSDGSDYGDASIPLELLPQIFEGWTILRSGALLGDPYQITVTLLPV